MSLTPREYLDALGRLPQATRPDDELPRITAHLLKRLKCQDGEDALHYLTHWSRLAALEFLAEAEQAFERIRKTRNPQQQQQQGVAADGSAALGLQVVDIVPDLKRGQERNNATERAIADAVAASRGGGGGGGGNGDRGGIVALATHNGRSPFEANGGGGGYGGDGGRFSDGLTKGEDALLSFNTTIEVEVEIVSTTPRLLVRLPGSFPAATLRAAAVSGGGAFRLDRLAYRGVLTRRLRAIAALVEAPSEDALMDGVGGGAPSMVGRCRMNSEPGFSQLTPRLLSGTLIA